MDYKNHTVLPTLSPVQNHPMMFNQLILRVLVLCVLFHPFALAMITLGNSCPRLNIEAMLNEIVEQADLGNQGMKLWLQNRIGRPNVKSKEAFLTKSDYNVLSATFKAFYGKRASRSTVSSKFKP